MCNVSMIVIYCVVIPTVRLCIREWPRWRRESVQNYETVYRARWWQDKNWYYSNETPIPTNIHKIGKQLGETSFFFYIYIQFIKINDMEHILATVSTLWWGHINTTFPLKHKTDLWVKIQNYVSFKICGSY